MFVAAQARKPGSRFVGLRALRHVCNDVFPDIGRFGAQGSYVYDFYVVARRSTEKLLVQRFGKTVDVAGSEYKDVHKASSQLIFRAWYYADCDTSVTGNSAPLYMTIICGVRLHGYADRLYANRISVSRRLLCVSVP